MGKVGLPPLSGTTDTDVASVVLLAIEAALGARFVKRGADADSFLEDFWGRAKGRAICVAQPGSVEDVSAVLRICQQHGVAVFPQGGNTSTCLGAVPDTTGCSIVLSLRRMNRLIEVDPADGSVTAEAGCILADIQKAAAEVGLLFPLSLGAEGSCQIGGNVSTNAGGTGVLRYGNTRDLVLGVQVVLPDGRVWDGLRTLRKNNTGYDLKHLFIGAEGSLGIITAVSLKLFRSTGPLTTVLIAFQDADDLPAITEPLHRAFDTAVIAMELLSGSEIRIVQTIFPEVAFPFGSDNNWFLLLDLAATETTDVTGQLGAVLEGAMERGQVTDVVVTGSEAQRATIWHLRHSVTEAHKKYGMGMSHDVAVPIGCIPRFLSTAQSKVEEAFPTAEVAVVGHVGDGNLHYNVMFEASCWAAVADKAQMRKNVYKAIYDLAASMNGTFSAEHGIGSLHVAEMKAYKSEVELDMMRAIKATFDPGNIMNPGRVLPS